jgi:small-conductance mechanosensitive channel
MALSLAWTAAQDTGAILAHLNAVISWYRHIASLDINAGQPSDALYLENARNSAAQAAQFAFQASEAEAALPALNKNGATGANTNQASAGSDEQTAISKAVADTNNRISQTQSQLDKLNQQIAETHGKNRQELSAPRDTLQGELELDKTILDAVEKVASVNNNADGGTGLLGQINQLKQSVPEVFAVAKTTGTTSTTKTSKSSQAQSSGLLGQATVLFEQMSDIHDIDQLLSETQHLRDTAEKLDAPLREVLKNLIQQGRNIVNQPPATSQEQIAATRKQFETLTAEFKQVSAVTVPLRQEMILLDQCRGDLLEWRRSLASEYKSLLRSLLTRVALILIALSFVFVLSAAWRRAIYRYVRDTRRRRQLMLIRRFITGFLMVVVIALGFVSEFSSLATFAGFITAGLAVALQTVILSVAAYFFIMGRYGVRVGDRVTIAGVTGDVIEIGLVRLYIMELGGTGIDLYPTGRVVVFSNSVMFQAAPFFKQLPGTGYAWHELAVTLAPDANLALLEQKLLDAVNSVFEKYRHNIDHQHEQVERILDASIAEPVPVAKVQFSESGPEFVVRYPVEIQHAADIDDQVTRKLMEVINSDPQLKAAVSASPKLRAPIKA